jgi:endonuclease III
MTPGEKRKLLKIFVKLYPHPRSELNFKTHYQLIVSVILSAQCTDKKVNQVTPVLFKKYSSFAELGKARLNTVEKIIRPINYYKTKSKNIIAMAKIVDQELKGKLPKKHEELQKLPGVGRKTANVVLVEMGKDALPVDTHVFRVSRRLGLAKGRNPDQVEDELKQEFKSEHWRNLHHWLIFHGRRVCKAQRPLCGECRLSDICPSAG